MKAVKTNKGESKNANAYLTVVLALCLTLVMSFCVALIEGARRNGGRLEAECVAEIAMESVMAEYHRELVKQYNLFAIDSSYGTAVCGKQNVEEHLKMYLKENVDYEDLFLEDYLYRDFFRLQLDDTKVTNVSILTDCDGKVFRRAAINAIGDDVGIGLLEEVQQWMQTIEVNSMEDGGAERQKEELDREIAGYDGTEVETKETGKETVTVVNPTELIEEKRKLGILKQIGPEDIFSQKRLITDSLMEGRVERGEVNVGNTVLSEQDSDETVIGQFLFREYLLKYMGRYGQEKTNGALAYQTEYLIAGKDADIDNLRTIVNRICVIREAANALYLMRCEVKREEIKLLSEVICTLILLPQLTPVMEAAILLGWAYAESVYDVKTLLAGGSVPLLKSDDDWHCGLSAALSGDWGERDGEGEGLCYQDYLRVFLMFEDEDVLTVRAMNMMEADIRNTPGNSCFRLDACYVAIEADIAFESEYGYRYEMTCSKEY